MMISRGGVRNRGTESRELQEKSIMPINECCNIDVVCCDADASIPDVAALMRKHHVGDVIVVEDRDGLRVPISRL